MRAGDTGEGRWRAMIPQSPNASWFREKTPQAPFAAPDHCPVAGHCRARRLGVTFIAPATLVCVAQPRRHRTLCVEERAEYRRPGEKETGPVGRCREW